jgi:hypothetical protein
LLHPYTKLNHPAYASIAGALIYLASVIILIIVVIAGCEQWIHSQPYLAGVPAATEVVQHAVDFEHFGSLITNIKLTGQRVAFSGER